MSALREGRAVPMELPIGGMDLNQPIANMNPANSPWLLNVDCENQKIRSRPGAVIHTVVASTTTIRALGVYGSGKGSDSLFAYCHQSGSNHLIYDVSTATESLVETCDDDDSGDEYPANFNGRLAFVTPLDSTQCARVWDGSTWNDWGFTYSGSEVCGYTVINYRSRVYIFNGQKCYYGSVSAVSGATSEVDFADILDYPGAISWAAIFPFSTGNINDTYLAFGTESGEILIYSGSYPGSATWSLVQKFKVDTGLGLNTALRFKNDVWILTRTGVVSLRSLLTYGVSEPAEYSPSYPINDYITKLAANYTSALWGGNEKQGSICYWPEKNRIYILLPGAILESGSYSSAQQTICSYNTLTGAWSIWHLSNLSDAHLGGLTYYQNGVYFYTASVVMKLNPALFGDEIYNSAGNYLGADYVIDGAYSDFGTRNKGKRIHAVSPLFKTDYTGTKVGVTATADMGRSESGTAYVGLVDGYNSPYYQVGVAGKRVKYRISGSSDTSSVDGFELYAVDAVIEPQESVR